MKAKDYEAILDSLQMTGVYVIREDDHKILYFNKDKGSISESSNRNPLPRIVGGVLCKLSAFNHRESKREPFRQIQRSFWKGSGCYGDKDFMGR